jgi:DNA-binding NtrC family response regulator
MSASGRSRSERPSTPTTARINEGVPPARVQVHDCVLEVHSGVDKGRQFDLERGVALVGTDPANDVVLYDTAVSRRHLLIRDEAAGCLVEDLGSTNGTFIEGTRIKQAYVERGTRIKLGGTLISVEARSRTLAIDAASASECYGILGKSPKMRQLFGQIEMFAPSQLSIVLHGESGTGKEIIAHAIHLASKRASGPYSVLDCAAVDPALVASSLFGHKRGAFTGATDARKGILLSASGGTVFIDELGELPPEVQPRLLRAVEQRTIMPIGADTPISVDVRFVCATHRDLSTMVDQGRFRQDLLYRLSGVVLEIPPLRERIEDVALLADHFLNAVAPDRKFDAAAYRALEVHGWPGNVRELKNVVERAAVAASGTRIRPGDLGLPASAPSQEARVPVPEEDVPQSLDEVEKRAIVRALKATSGHREKAAGILGISTRTLREKIKRYGIVES